MLCDICKKNKAVIHYAEVINNKVKKLNLCEECALAEGIGIQPPFSIGELLGGLTPPGFAPKVVEKITCPLCGMTFSKFKEIGKLGCYQCYETFSKSLIPLLKSIHKSSKHVGKVPSGEVEVMDTVVKIRDLENKLRRAVENEEYELAAKFRDEIRVLEKSSKGGFISGDDEVGKTKRRRK